MSRQTRPSQTGYDTGTPAHRTHRCPGSPEWQNQRRGTTELTAHPYSRDNARSLMKLCKLNCLARRAAKAASPSLSA